jgi:RNA polymerase sigma-70 factor (ECF subfamily)
MDTWQTTTTLLRSLRDFSDELAWRRLAGRFRAPLVRLAEQAGLSGADAEDAAQETLLTFARLYRSGRYEPARGRLHHWLLGIARRQIADARRIVGRRRVTALGDDAAVDALAAPDVLAEIWEQEWQRHVRDVCLQQVRRELAPQTVEMFERAVIGGESPETVGCALGVASATVYVAKHRVLRRLRELRQAMNSLE